MTGKMDWRKARLYGRRTLDHRFENELPDRAERWLQKVEGRRLQQQRVKEASSVIAVRRRSTR